MAFIYLEIWLNNFPKLAADVQSVTLLFKVFRRRDPGVELQYYE